MHLAHRFLCVEKANRRVKNASLPAVVRLFAPAETNNPVSGTGGLDPRVILLGHRYLRTEKSHRCSCQYRASSGPPQKTEKLKPMQHLEAPRVWPNKAIKCGGHGSVSRGDRRGSQRDQGRTGSNYTNERAEAASQSPIGLWPHLQAHILP
jgi:hypothetical protein